MFLILCLHDTQFVFRQPQYTFLYLAALEGMESCVGQTAIATSQFNEKYESVCVQSFYTNQSPLSDEFQVNSNEVPF